jgi:hypothetical protein
MAPPPDSRRHPALPDSRADAKDDELALWARAKAVFLEALERRDAERLAFVVEACGGNSRLREEVESLLASDVAATGLLETPVVGDPGGSSPE